MALIKETFPGQALLELHEGQLQGPDAGRFKVLADQLVFAALVIDRYATACNQGDTVAWPEFALPSAADGPSRGQEIRVEVRSPSA